jgi:hypothetical protein
MAEINQNVSTPEKVQGSFVKATETQAPVPVAKELTQSELLTRIYEVEVFIGKTLKDTNELLATMLANQGKLQMSAPIPVSTAPVPAVSNDPKLAKIVAALADFKDDKQSPLLNINANENNMFYIVKTTGFLGSDVFAKIARLIKTDFGGEYVSQGKASHFRISKA